jgi:hypothetical protein
MRNYWLDQRGELSDNDFEVLEELFLEAINDAPDTADFWFMKCKLLNIVLSELGAERCNIFTETTAGILWLEKYALLGDKAKLVRVKKMIKDGLWLKKGTPILENKYPHNDYFPYIRSCEEQMSEEERAILFNRRYLGIDGMITTSQIGINF